MLSHKGKNYNMSKLLVTMLKPNICGEVQENTSGTVIQGIKNDFENKIINRIITKIRT